jgi:antitoxin (DNA-binding transcriptional repressor) of toxin-antitoxin stability system
VPPSLVHQAMRPSPSEPLYVSIVEARSRLAELINRVAFGHEIIILTRHDKPICALTAIQPQLSYRSRASKPRRKTSSKRDE